MKKIVLILTCSLIFSGVGLSQAYQTVKDTIQISEAASRLARSTNYLDYVRALSRIGIQKIIDANNIPHYNTKRKVVFDDLFFDKTLNYQQRTDSLNKLNSLYPDISTTNLNIAASLASALNKELPELMQMSTEMRKSVFKTAGVLYSEAHDMYDKVFTKTQKGPEFPGGSESWKKYLERNLDANVAVKDGAPVGTYTVKVQFIVDKEGTVSKVQAIEVPKACPSCGTEAKRFIRDGPKWNPAIQNGRNVMFQAVQLISFQVGAL